MSLSQHRHILPLISISLELCNQLFNLRIEALFQSLFYRERHTCVVDILRCQTKMDKLLVSIQASDLIEFFLDKILNSLYIVIGNLLDVFYALCFLFVKITINVTQTFKQRLVERSKLWQR
ncbi:Uncharacterised protein [Segatella copri]|nr:Uncharacterised protein [Segatella copri]